MITTRNQFNGGIKTLSNQGAKARSLIQELLITSYFYAEADGDVAPLNRVIEAMSALKSIDMWKIHKHVKMYAPVKLSEDGKAYAFDKAKRNLAQGASREEYSAHETVMRQADPWYDLAKKEVTAADVWSAETGFENFMKRLTKEGYGEAADAIKSTLAKLKKDGKLRKLAEKAQEEVGEASY